MYKNFIKPSLGGRRRFQAPSHSLRAFSFTSCVSPHTFCEPPVSFLCLGGKDWTQDPLRRLCLFTWVWRLSHSWGDTAWEREVERYQSTLPLTPLGPFWATSSVRGMVPVVGRKWSVRWEGEIQFPGLVQSIITLSQSWFLHIFYFLYTGNACSFK